METRLLVRRWRSGAETRFRLNNSGRSRSRLADYAFRPSM